MTAHPAQCTSDAKQRIDLFDKTQWNEYREKIKRTRSESAVARRLMPQFNGDYPAVGIWGFDPELELLRFFSGTVPSSTTGKLERYQIRRSDIRILIEFGKFLHSFKYSRPSLSDVRSICMSTDATDELKSWLSTLGSSKVLFWQRYSKLILVGLFDIRSTEDRTFNATRSQSIDRTLERAYEYFMSRAILWYSLPYSVFYIHQEAVELCKVFADPLTFNPEERNFDEKFLWPWQRCLCLVGKSPGAVEYAAIPTTSLALDLRSSTLAMSAARDAGAFANFIEEVVAVAKDTVLRNGGFFDKETGDGIVAHFFDTQTGHGRCNERAIDTAVEIIKSVRAVCETFQDMLSHGLAGLGPAVGVHSGEAVWVITGQQVRAIGSSVIGAVRLCSNAACAEIVVSNSVYRDLTVAGRERYLEQFSRKSVTIKELQSAAAPYAFGLLVT